MWRDGREEGRDGRDRREVRERSKGWEGGGAEMAGMVER